jgi:hypothetical protein
MKSHQPKIALALPDSKPWGITRFYSGINDHASCHKKAAMIFRWIGPFEILAHRRD